MLVFGAFLFLAITALPQGVGFSIEVHDAFYMFGSYLHKVSYFLPTAALYKVIVWTIAALIGVFAIKVVKWTVGIIRGAGTAL